MNFVNKLAFFIIFVFFIFFILLLHTLITQSVVIDIYKTLSNQYVLHVMLFTVWQSILSTFISIIIAVPVGIAIFEKKNKFSLFLIDFSYILQVIPALVIVFGIIAVFGNNGVINSVLQLIGLDQYSFQLYGLSGILLAHIYFNLPLATRFVYQGLSNIPNNYHSQSQVLGLRFLDNFKLIYWPFIVSELPKAAILIFVMSFTSFAIILTLGGGPKATTIGVAIYQFLMFNFDFGSATILGIIQVIVCSLAIYILNRKKTIVKEYSTKQIYKTKQKLSFRKSFLIYCILFIFGLFIFLPILAVIIDGCNVNFFKSLSQSGLWLSLMNSLIIGISSTILSFSISIPIIFSLANYKYHNKYKTGYLLLNTFPTLIMAIPSIIIAACLFINLYQYTNVFLTMFLVIIVNAIIMTPFIINFLSEPIYLTQLEVTKLCQTLGISGWRKLLLIDWLSLREVISKVISFCIIFSFGDLSVIIFFGSQDFKTLPLYLYELLGSYDIRSAGNISLFYLSSCVLIYLFIKFIFSGKLCFKSKT